MSALKMQFWHPLCSLQKSTITFAASNAFLLDIAIFLCLHFIFYGCFVTIKGCPIPDHHVFLSRENIRILSWPSDQKQFFSIFDYNTV